MKALRGGDIQTIKEGDAIILDPIDLPVNIRANVSGVTSKVQFNLSGSQGFIKNAFERVRPFMLFGDKHGWVFNPGNIPVDDYHIRVTFFDMQGKRCEAYEVDFSILAPSQQKIFSLNRKQISRS